MAVRPESGQLSDRKRRRVGVASRRIASPRTQPSGSPVHCPAPARDRDQGKLSPRSIVCVLDGTCSKFPMILKALGNRIRILGTRY